MTILSDAQIETLCVVPEMKLDEAKYFVEIQKPVAVPAIFFHDARDEIAQQEARHEELKQRCMRPLTEDEREAFVPMITPFSPELIRTVEDREIRGGEVCVDTRKIISRGLTSYGYDVSLACDEIKLFTNLNTTIIDPKRLNDKCLVDAEIRTDVDGAKYVLLPPNSYLLGHTIEYFRIPRDVMVVCLGKSTYARAGAIVNVTPIEPGFEGTVVIEIGNSTNLPLKIYLNEGISQFLFFRGEQPCRTSYGDRGGKYQGQTGVTLPKV